jgi:hypothetical protein
VSALRGFDALGGPLVAVCGLAGGAGTTLLARLLAHEAAAASAAPALLAELPANAGDAARPGATSKTGAPPRATPLEPAALAAARERHGIVVVDCGRLHAHDARAALELASHVLWAAPAGPDTGALATSLLLDSDLAPPPGSSLETLVVVATRPASLAPGGHRALRRVATERCERLVLVPHVRPLARGRSSAPPSRRLGAALHAIGGVLARRPQA